MSLHHLHSVEDGMAEVIVICSMLRVPLTVMKTKVTTVFRLRMNDSYFNVS